MRRLLLIPGDGPERDFIIRAGGLISRLLPSCSISSFEFGRYSWELANEVLPPDTEDAVMEADVILCGRADVEEIRKKDPLETIASYNDLFARVTHVVSLFKSQTPTSLAVATPLYTGRRIRELDSLYGAESTFASSADEFGRLVDRCVATAAGRGIESIVCATCGEFFPRCARVAEEAFRSRFPEDEGHSVMPCGAVAERLARRGGGTGLVIGEMPAMAAVRGLACGLVDGAGLMPDVLLGDRLSVYCPALDSPRSRRANPTSVYLSAADLLMDNGHREEGERILRAVREMYARKTVDRDMTGRRTAKAFMDGVESVLFPEMRSGELRAPRSATV